MSSQDVFEYVDSKGDKKRLDVIRPEFSLEGLSDNEIEALQLLQEAQREFDSIRFRQNHPDGLEHLLEVKSSSNQIFKDFFSTNAGINDRMGGDIKSDERFTLANPNFGGLYPQDMKKEEFEALPEEVKYFNHSLVIRDDKGKLQVVKNSEMFKQQIGKVVQKLREVTEKVPALSSYANATIKFLQDESEQHRLDHFREWANNKENIDFVFDTAQEDGYDLLHGLRGIAEGDSFRTARRYDEISELMLEYVKELDERAPWKHKADKLKVPGLKFVDVLSFRGNHLSTPAITLGQNLPNEQLLKDEVGGVVLIYANTIQARKSVNAEFFREEFYPHMSSSLDSLIPLVDIYMTAAHEFGHATSKTLFDEPTSVVFGPENYYIIEEGRAETFSLFAMGELVKDGRIPREYEEISYYTMLQTMCDALSKERPTAHRGARNMMFHYMLDNQGIIEEQNNQGLPIFRFDLPKARAANRTLLGILGDIRSEGRVEDARDLISQYVRTDRWEEFERRFQERGSSGVATIFPQIIGNKENGFKLEYVSNMSDHITSAMRNTKN